jgi:hypothetical protein
LKYITAKFGEKKEDVLNKLKRELGSGFYSLYSLEKPSSLMGNSKILSLRYRGSNEIRVKIDGPGFLMDDLFNEFS